MIASLSFTLRTGAIPVATDGRRAEDGDANARWSFVLVSHGLRTNSENVLATGDVGGLQQFGGVDQADEFVAVVVVGLADAVAGEGFDQVERGVA